ncbi:restriction endonuclease, partial [Planctomycetaceae bacterium SCGC AG-212-D15]
TERNVSAFRQLFGTPHGRYASAAEKDVSLRAPAISSEKGVPFAAYIHKSNPTSGAYGGTSFAYFPVSDGPCLVSLVVGTQGLSPDEVLLSRPGHARKVQAICSWLNKRFGKGRLVAWAKQDPVRIDLAVPETVRKQFAGCDSVFDRYGRVLYAIFRSAEPAEVETGLAAFLDLLFDERGHMPLKAIQEEASSIRSGWFEELFPRVTGDHVAELLSRRRYVIVQGPPGTGKTRLALQLLKEKYGGHGTSVQFHANTTYEQFIGGLAPVHGQGALGLQFAPRAGFLMDAAAVALQNPNRPFLLHIDEINRADLAKVLGEAVYLLEADDHEPRQIRLPYDFGKPFQSTLFIPNNLHIIGTMNTSDRSIALVDIAIRRRFTFVRLWPDSEVVRQFGGAVMRQAYEDLISLFVEHAGVDVLDLVPGHSYFLEMDDEQARRRLKTTLLPLLEEYLAQGLMGGFAEPARAYLQWVKSL